MTELNEPIFGIDLGTTNSCLAVVENGRPRIIAIDEQPTVPSVVSIDPATGEVIVGTRARNRRALYPDLTVSSIKRQMGSAERIQLGKRALLPEEISAEILRYLKSEGGRALGREVRRVVITVPAYFEDAQRRATIKAGELAGLEVVRIINEPTAASLVYEHLEQQQIDAMAGRTGDDQTGETGDGRTLLVYDLGGGTFDVSVVRLEGDIYEVCASCGDTHLGGDDFDQLLVQHLVEQVDDKRRQKLRKDRRAMARLSDAAERAKIELSSRPFTEVMEEALAPSVDLRYELERRTFESLIAEHLERTIDKVERALHEASMKAADISRVVLVGGSTRIPAVLELLEDRLQRRVEHSLDPDLCVALGAAVQGAVLAGEAFDRILIDVSAHSLGIRSTTFTSAPDSPLWMPAGGVEHDCFSVIIPRNTQVPVTRSEIFYTCVDDQEAADIEVFQGEEELCSDNTEIGSYHFKLKPAPETSPVVVELSYDLEGIIHVVVDQKGTGNRGELTLSSRHLSEPQLPATTRQEAAAQAPDESADNFMLRKARRLLGELPDGELRTRLEETVGAYQALLAAAGNDETEIDRIEDTLLELMEEAEDLIEDEQET